VVTLLKIGIFSNFQVYIVHSLFTGQEEEEVLLVEDTEPSYEDAEYDDYVEPTLATPLSDDDAEPSYGYAERFNDDAELSLAALV